MVPILLLFLNVLRWALRPPLRFGVLLEAMVFVGFESLPIVLLISLFVGAVFALQLASALRTFQAQAYVGATVGLALTRELAPVFTAIVVAARAGAGMATELGSMRITEQIDALATMAINPAAVPDRAAGARRDDHGADAGDAVQRRRHGRRLRRRGRGCRTSIRGCSSPTRSGCSTRGIITQGLVKAVVFGTVLTLIACNQGYNAGGGAKGVGVATTRSVVGSFVTILVLDYFLTDMWLTFFTKSGGA